MLAVGLGGAVAVGVLLFVIFVLLRSGGTP
jgi:hypothetical protein